MKGKLLPPNGNGRFRWVVKSENRKDIIGLVVDDDIWFGIEDILQNEELHQYYHQQLKKKEVKDE